MSTRSNRIYLSPPHMSGGELKYVHEAFDTNWVAPLGANVDAFEESLASFCNVKNAAALSSGTAAIHLALILLGIKPGDEVIASTFTFSATINPIVYLGARPILVDSEPKTWNMDPDLLEETLNSHVRAGNIERVKAIIVVHLYGMPANMERITAIADKFNIPLIEDAAEALGSRYMGRPAGSFGTMAVLSFNGNKIITTSGGGALLSNNKELIEKARFLATQARDNAPHYQHSQIGYNYRMSNVLAGIGRGQMEVINDRVRKRRETFSFYKEHLGKFDGLKFLEEPSGIYFSNHWLTCIVINPEVTGISREILQKELESLNIESRPLWKPMHLQPVFAQYPAYLTGVSEELFKQGLCLPSGTALSSEAINKVVDAISKCIVKGC